MQVVEVAARPGMMQVFTLPVVLAGLIKLGSVVASSLFLHPTNAFAARDQRAGAASLRPGVRRPPLLARKPCHLPRTYPSDLVHPSAGCGCMEDGDRLQMACSVASHSRPVERVCSMTLPEAVLARVWSDWDTVCSFRTPVSAGELDMCVSWRSGVVVGSANTRDVQTCIRCCCEKLRRSPQYCGHRGVYKCLRGFIYP